MLQCKECKQEIEEDEFAMSGYIRKGDGARSKRNYCKKCAAQRTKKYRATHPVYAAAATAATEAWRKKNPFRHKLTSSKAHAKRLGYSPCNASAFEIAEAFSGKCHICGTPEIECTTKLHLDHNHATGEFRGCLCGRCNVGIGILGDSEAILTAAINYLESPKKAKKRVR